MGWTSESYENEARIWDAGGRLEPVADPWHTMLMGCWVASAGARHDGVSDLLHSYLKALQRTLDRRNTNWLDDLFDDREYCRICGQSWRTENCSLCTACSCTYPPCCSEKRGFLDLPNGNRGCPSCGRGEVVG